MILTCPSCQTRYVVPDSAIGPTGRKVRCASCRHSWFQEPATLDLVSPTQGMSAAPEPVAAPPPDAFAAQAPAAEPEAEPPVGPPPQGWQRPEPEEEEPARRPRRNRAGLWTILALVFAVLALGATMAIMFLDIPQIQSRIGMPAKSEDALAFEGGTAQTRRLERGNDMLEVSGTIVNRTDQVQRVPQIQAALKDAQGRVVYSWSIAPPVRELPPRGRATFNSANVGVPRGARELSLNFGPIS